MPVLVPLLLLAGSARALVPVDDAIPGGEPARVRRVHPATQLRLRRAEPWRRFLAGAGAGWMARFDEHAAVPRAAWGPGIELGLAEDAGEEEVFDAVLRFVAEHEDLLGVRATELRPARAARNGDRWFVRLDRVLPVPAGTPVPRGVVGADPEDLARPAAEGGNPLAELGRWDAPLVWRGGMRARIVHGRLVSFGMGSGPDVRAVDPRPALSADEAIARAVDDGPAAGLAPLVDGTALVVLPGDGAAGELPRLAWAVRLRVPDAEPPGAWTVFVDAHDGGLVGALDEVRTFQGTVTGLHDARTVNGDTDTSPLPYLRVLVDGAPAYTDADGRVSASGSTGEIDGLAGEWVRVVNRAGEDGGAEWSGGELTLDSEDATWAEIDSYVFLHRIRDWALEYAPDLGIVSELMRSNVNVDGSCNAYYDGAVNFYREGGGCNNTGRIADVNYHEWGHGLHYYAAGSWYVDYSVGEGSGDTSAFLMTRDPVIAPGFYTGSSVGIRDVSVDYVYPDDVVGESHQDGLIFAGAMWDLLDILTDELGADEAHAVVSRLFVDALRDNPELDTTYDAVVAADDDDGDLSNGTPHQCAIVEAFGRHGLGPFGGQSLLSLAHDPVGNQYAQADVPVEAEIVDLAPDCVEAGWKDGAVHYSTDGGETWEEAPLDATDTGVAGAIPGQPAGTVVWYYITVETADGDEISVPEDGSINPFSFYVGPLEPVWCEDFEDDDGGFTHELVSGTDEEGADDWQWGPPRGEGGDPDAAWSGHNVWGNDLGGGNYDGEYQNGKHNRLSSPPVDVSGLDTVVVQFRRWLTVEDGFYDQARVLANGEVVWSNHATNRNIGDEHHLDEQWALHTLVLDVSGTDTLELAWELESDRGLTFGGWNIDDVCVYRLGEPAGDTGVELDTGGPSSGDGGAAAADTGELALGGCGCAASGGRGPGGAILALAGLLGLVGARRRSG